MKSLVSGFSDFPKNMSNLGCQIHGASRDVLVDWLDLG
jgi:hypothetical protein